MRTILLILVFGVFYNSALGQETNPVTNIEQTEVMAKAAKKAEKAAKKQAKKIKKEAKRVKKAQKLEKNISGTEKSIKNIESKLKKLEEEQANPELNIALSIDEKQKLASKIDKQKVKLIAAKEKLRKLQKKR